MVDQTQELPNEEQEDSYESMFAETFGDEHSAEDKSDEDRASPSEEDSPEEKDRSEDAREASKDGEDHKPKGIPDPYKWIQELPESVREQAEALRQQQRSSTGRVSALQRRINELEARLEARKKTQSEGRSKAANQPDQEDDPETLQEFMEKYPTLAKSVESLVRQKAMSLQEAIDERYGPIAEEIQATKSMQARERLEQGARELFETERTGIDYREVIESEFYRDEFLANQPKEFQDIAMNTTDPDTALWVLKQFKEYADEYAEKNGLVDERSNTGNRADRASARRTQSRRTAGTVEPRTALTDMENDMSYEAEFARRFGGKR